MKKINLKKYKLRIQMTVTNTLIAILTVVLFSVITYHVFEQDSNELVTESLTSNFELMADRMDEYFNTVNTLTDVFSKDEEVQSVLSQTDMFIADSDSEMLSAQLQNVILLNPTIREGYVVTNRNEIISASNGADTSFLHNLLKKEQVDFDNGAFLAIESKNNQNQIAAVKTIKSFDTGKKLGYVVMLADKQRLLQIFETDLYDGKERFLLLDSSGNLVFQPEHDEKIPVLSMHESMPEGTDSYVSTIEIDGDAYKYNIKRSAESGWEVVVMVPEEVLYSHSVTVGNTILVYIIIIIVLGMIFTTITNMSITKPITRLAEAIDRVASGDFKHKIAFSAKNEVTFIADNFNNMVDEIQGLTKKIFSTQQRLYETELERKQFELSLLQSQINSHFLYNTLSCIRAMSRKGATEEVSNMISSLVHMLRYASNMQDKTVLQDEFTNIRHYVYIQRMRLGEQLQLIFDENDDIMNSEVPKMILQPVVENSILHAFNTKKGEWSIRVSAKRKDDNLTILITDNGCGMSAKEMEKLSLSLKEKKSIYDTNDAKNSIGLVNIQNRIRSLYGDDYGVRVRSWKNIGTAVAIQIPYKRSDEYVFRTFN